MSAPQRSYRFPVIDKARLANAPRWLPNDVQEMEEHIRVLHPEGTDGSFVLAEKWHGRYKQALHRTHGRIPASALQHAQFVSMNRFAASRMGDALCSVGHVWLEFDPYGEDAQGNPLPHRHTPLEDLKALLSEAIAAAGIPAPSYWSKSGRGLHAVWVCNVALPGYAAPKLQRIIAALYGPTLNEDGSVPARRFEDPDRDAQEARLAPVWRLFRDTGLDTQTQDSSRVLRIWGSYNPKSGTRCERLWPIWIEDIQRYAVDTLADSVLPITREELRRRLAERAANPAAPAKAKAERPRRTRSATAYAGKVGVWDRKLADLLRLRQHRGRIAKGHRHAWVFLTANAHAQAKGGTAAMWAELLAPLAGLTVADALDCLRSLDRRQARHEAGETTEHGGVVWSPLFHYSGSKMANLLGVTEEEADAAGLNLVRPGTGRAIPPIERKAAKRVRDGAVPRADRADAKLQAGRQGLALRAEGKSANEAIEAIRATTGRGRTWAIEAMRLAAATPDSAVAAEPVPAPAAPRKSASDRVRFSGRYIGGVAPAPASTPSAPAIPAPVAAPKAYAEPDVIRVSDISTRLIVAPGVEYLVVDDPEDRFLGRWVLLFVDGQHADATLPAHLEPYLPVRRLRAPRPVRSASRRRPVTDARTPFRPGMTTAEEYRRLTRGF